MAWEISMTTEFEAWYHTLNPNEQNAIVTVVELLADQGPQLGRPHADRITGSKIHNLKELRPQSPAKNCRILFAFDPQREAILLTGGDKSGQWKTWYETAIPQAERLYNRYLIETNQQPPNN